MSYQYTAYPFQGDSPLEEPWAGPHLQAGEEACVDHFHAASSPHRPVVRAKLMYDAANLYLRFRVEDRYVVAKHTEFQDPVWRDSCVEFFVQPRSSGGYFNFEINCGGALLSYYIEDPTRTADGFAKFTRMSAEHGRRIGISHSMPSLVVAEPGAGRVAHRLRDPAGRAGGLRRAVAIASRADLAGQFFQVCRR